MANLKIDEVHFTNIANAIRSLNGAKKTYKPNEMPAAILNLGAVQDTVITELVNNREYITSLVAPGVITLGEYALSYCSRLEVLDLPDATYLCNYALDHCSCLHTVILRNNSVCGCSSFTSVLNTMTNSSPFNNGEGYIYVPRALVSSYQASAQWSSYADKILSIEDYPV